MKTLFLFAALALSSLGAKQASAQDPNETVQKLITLKYVDPRAVQGLLVDFGVMTRADPRLKVIALSGKRANVMTAEDAIRQLDVPGAAQKDIELTVYFVTGTDQTTAGTNPIPKELESTVATLKSTFPFKNYGLLDVLSLQTRSGAGAETSGQFGSRFTTFRIQSASLEGNGMIRLDRLHAGVRNPIADGPDKINYVDTGISTDVVDVKEGQKLVVGRSSLDGPEKALFLVLIAKVVP
jgi:hypothetical protein